MTDRKQIIAEALRQHHGRQLCRAGRVLCVCGRQLGRSLAWRDHVAEVIDAALPDPAEQVRAALDEAAERIREECKRLGVRFDHLARVVADHQREGDVVSGDVRLTEDERRELGPWNSRLLNETVERIVAARVQAARAEVQVAVEEWCANEWSTNVDLDDLYAVKGWSQ